MNRIAFVLAAIAVSVSSVFAQTTNISGSGSAVFSGLSFSGSTGEVAATVSSFSDFLSVDTSYEGGVGSSVGIHSPGAAGLVIQDVGITTISNQQIDVYAIKGGAGGNISSSTSSDQPEASGGAAVAVNAASSADFTGPGFLGDGDEINIDGALIQGGAGGVVSGVSGNLIEASGGAALTAEDAWVDINKGSLRGGKGGTVVGNGVSATARGGDGFLGGFDAAIRSLDENVTVIGGKGGTITSQADGTKADASGGLGMNHQGLNYFDPTETLTVVGGHFEGGQGGTVTGQDNVDVSGGSGFYMNFQNAVITGGEFVGGQGGVATITNSSASADADGGVGLYVFLNHSLDIQGGTFEGGAAGSVNGVNGNQGAALRVADSVTTISGGTFSTNGLGLWMETTTANGAMTIGGNSVAMGDVQLSSTAGFQNTLRISGSNTFGDVLFEGAGANDAAVTGGSLGSLTLEGSGQNVVALGGTASFGDLYLNGTDNTLSISNGVTSSGTVRLTGGMTDVNAWNDSNFADTAVSNGTLSFNNQLFTLGAGSSFALQSSDAVANFNGGLAISDTTLEIGASTVSATDFSAQNGSSVSLTTGALTADSYTGEAGSSLDVGYGAVTATTFSAVSSDIATSFSDADRGLITGDDLSFSNVTWTLTGSSTNKNLPLTLASANNSLDATNITLNVSKGSGANWNFGFSDWYTTNGALDLVVDYGLADLESAFGADPNSEFGRVVAALSGLYDQTSTQYEILTTLGDDPDQYEDQANYTVQNGYLRTPEMANTLMRQQNIFTDQVKLRTRGSLRYKNWGTSVASTGAAGPQFWFEDAKAWVSDRLPSWDVREDIRGLEDSLPASEADGSSQVVSKPYVGSTSGQARKEYKALGDQIDATLPKPKFGGWLTGWLPKWSFRDTARAADERLPRLNLRDAARTAEDRLSESTEIEIEVPATYQFWGRGYASRIDQGSTGDHAGYDARVAGAVAGVDKRFENLLVGLVGGYSRVTVAGGETLYGNAGNDAESDTLNGAAYVAANGEKAYFDANISYAFSNVETEGIRSLGYEGQYDASTLSMYLGGGLGFAFFNDSVLVSPEASIQATYYEREGYSESSSEGFGDKVWGSYDQWSYLSSVGATISMIRKIEAFELEMEFQPEIRAHWLHEFNPEMDDASYDLAGSGISVALQAREEDLFKVGAGMRFSKWTSDSLEFGLDVDGVFGSDYSACSFGGKLTHRF